MNSRERWKSSARADRKGGRKQPGSSVIKLTTISLSLSLSRRGAELLHKWIYRRPAPFCFLIKVSNALLSRQSLETREKLQRKQPPLPSLPSLKNHYRVQFDLVCIRWMIDHPRPSSPPAPHPFRYGGSAERLRSGAIGFAFSVLFFLMEPLLSLHHHRGDKDTGLATG